MFCKNCGAQLPDGSKFCTTCGASLDTSAQQTQQQPAYQQPAAKPSNPYVSSALAYIPILFWLPFVSEPKTAFGRACANQGLVALIFQIGISIVSTIVTGIFVDMAIRSWNYSLLTVATILGWLFAAVAIAIGVCCIIGIVKAWKGQFFEIPVIGKIRIIK